jgi:hypothetical protein
MDRLRADGWNDPRPGRSEAPGRDRRERARRRSDQPRLLEREELPEIVRGGPVMTRVGDGEWGRKGGWRNGEAFARDGRRHSTAGCRAIVAAPRSGAGHLGRGVREGAQRLRRPGCDPTRARHGQHHGQQANHERMGENARAHQASILAGAGPGHLAVGGFPHPYPLPLRGRGRTIRLVSGSRSISESPRASIPIISPPESPLNVCPRPAKPGEGEGPAASGQPYLLRSLSPGSQSPASARRRPGRRPCSARPRRNGRHRRRRRTPPSGSPTPAACG